MCQKLTNLIMNQNLIKFTNFRYVFNFYVNINYLDM